MTVAPSRPRIAVTFGDPAGIGPELAARLLTRVETLERASVFVLADRDEYERAFTDIGLPMVPVSDSPRAGHVVLLSDDSSPADAIPVKQVSAEAGHRALHQLRRAVALARQGAIDAIVFLPLNKTSMHLAGMAEEDELRWFAKHLDFEGTTSELNVLGSLWTARVTSHIPMSRVAEHITIPAVSATIRLLHTVLRDSGKKHPRIAVSALNPHAGENGNFGREEIDVIAPAVQAAGAAGMDVTGPYPADTVFLAARRGDFDGVVTMYHDQGQIAMKLIGFDAGVTVQGGLPVTIATPAHGTAFDIVGTGAAHTGSTENAFDIAVAIASRRARPERHVGNAPFG